MHSAVIRERIDCRASFMANLLTRVISMRKLKVLSKYLRFNLRKRSQDKKDNSVFPMCNGCWVKLEHCTHTEWLCSLLWAASRVDPLMMTVKALVDLGTTGQTFVGQQTKHCLRITVHQKQ